MTLDGQCHTEVYKFYNRKTTFDNIEITTSSKCEVQKWILGHYAHINTRIIQEWYINMNRNKDIVYILPEHTYKRSNSHSVVIWDLGCEFW